MTIRTRLTLGLGGILMVSMAVLAGALDYEWNEQVRRLREDNQEAESAWEEAGEVVLFYGVPTALLLLLGGGWLLRQSLAPIATLTRAAERIHLHNLKERITQSGNGDELDRLAQVFNSMMSRLDDSLTHLREFTLHASHELKTPLTILRGEIEIRLRGPQVQVDREFLAGQLDEIERLTRIVDGLAFLARTEASEINAVSEQVRFDELVQDSFADAQLLAQPNHLKVELGGCEPVIVRGDRHRLRQLLLNLTDNAIKYNQPGGRVAISLSDHTGTAELTISNTGSGIAPEKLPRVFDRFYRGDSAHSSAVEGAGLGLSIAQRIVNAHGGDIRITSEPGKLTTVMVKLPAGSLPSREN